MIFWWDELKLYIVKYYRFFKSINFDILLDNPCPSGEINRVVQGVIIYPLASQ